MRRNPPPPPGRDSTEGRIRKPPPRQAATPPVPAADRPLLPRRRVPTSSTRRTAGSPDSTPAAPGPGSPISSRRPTRRTTGGPDSAPAAPVPASPVSSRRHTTRPTGGPVSAPAAPGPSSPVSAPLHRAPTGKDGVPASRQHIAGSPRFKNNKRDHLTLPSTGLLVAMGTVITDLPDTLVVEILSRLPPKALCRCKSVSTHWCNLISDPDNLKKLPQTLAGFFFETKDIGRSPKIALHFQNVCAGPPLIDPSFSFLPPQFERVELKDCCDGLLLCSSETPFQLVVCNPATERWAMVPDPGCVGERDTFALAFDRRISPHFHVFQIVDTEQGYVAGTKIYSSKTREWSYKDAGWDLIKVFLSSRHVFHHGMMYFVGLFKIVAVDTEGEKRIIPLPEKGHIFCDRIGNVGQSQGHLYYMSNTTPSSVWFLENYDTDEWTLKHRVSPEQLLGIRNQPAYYYEYDVISGHPDCSLFYIANHRKNLLMAYDIGREESEDHVAHAFGNLGRGGLRSVFPYVPLYQDLGLGCIA